MSLKSPLGVHATWQAAHDAAQVYANATGLSLGIEKPTQYEPGWVVRFIPAPKYRFGADWTCEAVESELMRPGQAYMVRGGK